MTLPENMNDTLAAILSVASVSLSVEESRLFEEARPLGFILFARNCESPGQLRALCHDLRACVGWDCPILIDQEGGRVQRLKPPVWRKYEPLRVFGEMAENDLEEGLSALRTRTFRIANDLLDCGINVNCDPVLDVLTPETHEAIGDRAFSSDPSVVARLGQAVCRNYLKAGVMPVIKHLPGHGRATMDGHYDLPHVLASLDELRSSDFKAFADVCASDIGPYIWGMAAHLIFEDIDPDHPSSVSSVIIEDIIRGEIGFDGLLLSDDLSMEALSAYGDVAERALASLEAGCDVALYCAGKMDEMAEIAKTVPKLSETALRRLQKAAEFRTLEA